MIAEANQPRAEASLPTRDPLPKARLAGGIALAGVSVAVALALPREAADAVVRHAGYYCILLAVLGFVSYLVDYYRSFGSRIRGQLWGVRGRFWSELLSGIGAVLIGSLLLFAHAEWGPKIAMDDYLLSATAKQMHETREVAMVTVGREISGTFKPLEVELDKRPWFYPFLVASLHDLTGYRPANAYAVNGLLAVTFLGLAYGFGRWIGGVAAGWWAVLLWISLPLLAQNATGGGMELTNLLMLQGVILLAALYLKHPCRPTEGLLSLGAVMLAYARYESLLFLAPVLLCLALGWAREKKVFLAWGTVAAPILLLGLLLQMRLYAETPASWEAAAGTRAPLAPAYFLENLPHALAFFFSPDHQLANSLLLSLLGFVAIPAFCLLLRTEWRVYRASNPAALALTCFAPFLLLSLAVAISFHAGALDRPYVSRYALPVHLLFVGASLALARYAAERSRAVWPTAIAGTALFVLAVTLPMNSKAVFSKSNFAVREQAWLERFSEGRMDRHALVIDRFSIGWTLREWMALEPFPARVNARKIADDIARGKFTEAYLVERLRLGATGFETELETVAALRRAFKTELVAERSFRPFKMTRIHRLTGYAPERDDDA